MGKASRKAANADRDRAALEPVMDAAIRAHRAGAVDQLREVLDGLPDKVRRRIEAELNVRLNPPDQVTDDQEAQLRELWATLPDVECRGKCWDSCGPIRMTGPEHALTARAGVDIPDGEYDYQAAMCPALTMLNRCGVYDARPTICRLWGISEHMPCTYGCRPEGGLLTVRQTWEVLAAAFRIAGDTETADGILDGWSTPERAAAIEDALAEDLERSQFKFAVHRERVKRKGTAVYVDGQGRLSKTPHPGVLQ